MQSSHARPASTIIVGLLIAAACTPAAVSEQDVTPTPPITMTPLAAGPTADTTSASPSPSAIAQPTPEPTPIPEPPKPTEVTFDQQVHISADGQVATVTQTVGWGAPLNEGVEIRVYGVTQCIALPADPPPDSSGPCLVVHTPLPASIRKLLATAPASDGVVSWTWTQYPPECDTPIVYSDPDRPPGYAAVVLAAYGPSGNSIFAIAAPGGWWTPALGDIVC